MKWLLIVAALPFLYGLHLLFLWMEDRGWIFYLRKKPSGGALGRACLEVQQVLQPETRHYVEAREKKKTQEDDQGGPDKAGGRAE